ncbi:Z1 domain-containing protein [Shewanella woodyi]|uniref:Z1 domain-containing protein n=1 Tax=Shewanella woodyi TaxID=60961 RepID=UPI0037481195
MHDYLDKDKNKHNIPFLIIDDEADNASLNNEGAKGHEYASKINGHIRALLQLFHKKSYLGYTATPFANVLQDRNFQPTKDWQIKFKTKGEKQEKQLKQVDNIFPDDFIYLLSPPSNYIGAKQIFETLTVIDNKAEGEKIPLLSSPVNDYISEFPTRVFDIEEPIGITNYANKKEWDEKGMFEDDMFFSTYSEYRSNTRASKAYDDFPKKLPESLKEAVICFILSIAIREKRKPEMVNSALYQPHHTMLIHISRFTLWQNKTSVLLSKYLSEVSLSILNDDPNSSKSVYFDVEKVWYKYYAEIVESIRKYLPLKYSDEFLTPMVFESVKKYLPDAVKNIEVKAINSITKQKLEYSKTSPKKFIAVGGNRLSRGFTLEGLTINYFIRNTNYSDTLLQMGRWFGYRPGYVDCCKLFTTEDAIEKYNQTTKCIEELEHEFKKMSRRGSSPEKFVLRVKKHPGVLKITRPSIMKNTVDVKWSYQDQLEMTTIFDVTKSKMERVWDNFKNELAPKLKDTPDTPQGFLSYKATSNEVIDLLHKENNFPSDDIITMVKFIQLCNEKNKLINWTVALKTTGSAKGADGLGKKILTPSESNLIDEVELSIRRGPNEKISQEGYRKSFLKDHKFHMTGRNANIISSSKDLSIRLNASTIKIIENKYYEEKIREIQKRKPSLTKKEARKEISTIPERVYREGMNEDEAVLIVYLFDSHYSFNNEPGKDNPEFKEYVEKQNIDLNVPLVGYAIGFPPIENDPGGIYVQGDYNLDEDEYSDESEYSNEDSPLPIDSQE